MKRNLLIRASAGSGKTRKLSLRYLELIASGVPIPTILASTFTNKATGEILNRILLMAAQACLDNGLRGELSQNVGRNISSDEMKDILRRLVKGMNQIRACSLDSFFNRIAQCFPYELGFKPGWKILDNFAENSLRWDALQRTLALNPQNTPTLLRQLWKGETQSDLASEIFNQMTDLYSLKRKTSIEAWEEIQKIPLHGYLTEEDISNILAVLDSALFQGNMKPSLDEKIREIIPKIQANDWYGLLDKTLFKNALDAKDGIFKFKKAVVGPPEVSDAIIKLAKHAVMVYFGLIKEQTYAVHELISRFSSIYDKNKIQANGFSFEDVTCYVAKYIEKLNGNLQSLSWRMNMSINHLLLDEFQDTSIDQWHIFQPFGKHCTQKDGCSFFCVGDVKQAIYRWRNGRPEIFDAIEKNLKGIEHENSNVSWRSAPEIIDCVNRFFLDPVKNPASNPANQDAAQAPVSPVRNYLDKTALEAWDKWAYEEHKASPKSQNYPGYWEISVMPEKNAKDSSNSANHDSESEDEVSDSDDVQLRWVAQRIAELYRKLGNVHQIGVLFRKNKKIPQLAEFLRQLGVPVSEEGKTNLANSNSVRLILSLLTLMDFPDNTFAWFHVGNSVLAHYYPDLAWKDLRQLSDEERAALEQKKSVCLAELRRKYQAFGVSVFLQENAKFLTPHASAEEKRRLKQLLQLAASTEQNFSMKRISSFVEAVKQNKQEAPSGASVMLMTIHSSKGLQFDAVVLPELDLSLTDKNPQFLVGYPQDDVLQAITLVMPWIKQNLRHHLFTENSPFLKAMELNERERIGESFSTLYVAMTRAIYAMYLFVPPQKKTSSVNKVYQLLTLALAETECSQPETILASNGDPEWFLKTGKMNSITLADIPNEIESSKQNSPIFPNHKELEPKIQHKIQPIIFKSDLQSSRNLIRRAPSNIEDRRMVDLGKKLDFSQQNTVNGTILHSWYEKIAWMENSLPSDEELIAVARPYGLNKERLERLLKSFHNSLKAPKIERVLHWTSYIPMLRDKVIKSGVLAEEKIPRTALRKDPSDPNEIRWEVYREKELAIRTESELLLGTLDRLILLQNDFQVFWADCMDYKTTRKVSNPDILEEKVKSHRPQMMDYRKMLHLHYRIPENQISTHLIFSMLGIVREV